MNGLLFSRIGAIFGITASTSDTGFLIRECEGDFRKRAENAVTHADLETFDDNPLLFIKQKQGLAEPKKDYSKDSAHDAVRVIVTQGREAFGRMFAICPIKNDQGEPVSRHSFAFSQWAESQDKIPLDAEQAKQAVNMAESVRLQPLAMDLLDEGIAETTIAAELLGTRCAGRVPWFHPRHGVITMLFNSYALDWAGNYKLKAIAREAAFSAALIECHVRRHIPVHVIAVETDQPQRCAVWRMSWLSLVETHRRHGRILRRLQEARRRNMWPGRFEKMRTLDWSFRII
jgi:hypothetical protein